jgi:hypothetical protein
VESSATGGSGIGQGGIAGTTCSERLRVNDA